MRTAVALLVFLIASGCAAQSRQWDKPGADRATAQDDLRDCRRAAKNVAWRNQFDYGIPRYTLPGAYSPSGRVDPYYVRREPDRFGNEARLVSFCMRNKGYELNAVPTDIRPPSPLR